MDSMYEVPSNPGIRKCVVTKETVESGLPMLESKNSRKKSEKLEKNTGEIA